MLFRKRHPSVRWIFDEAMPPLDRPAFWPILFLKDADVAQLVEHRLPKPVVAGSSPVVRLKCLILEAEWLSLC